MYYVLSPLLSRCVLWSSLLHRLERLLYSAFALVILFSSVVRVALC